MEKSLSRSDYLFAVMFIFMLVLALGAFFSGLKVGQERSAAKYEEQNARRSESPKGYTSYDQQYLVSFYHTIYQPYREFHKKWFETMDGISANRSADASLLTKDLAKLAEDTYAALSDKAMPDSSPLLQDSLQDYRKSLKLFGEALRSYTPKANAQPGAELTAQLENDSYIAQAKNFSLKAEKEFYDAILKWNETVNPQLKPVEFGNSLALADWSQLSLNRKNDYAAQMLLAGKQFKAFTPQDLTSRIDEMIASGQSKKMNLGDARQVADVLMATDAVRPGDFLRYKDRWYAKETLPQLPFFTN